MADNGSLPLGRYSVLDLTRARAGPTCVRQLVDWGARAIKIEMPGGRSGDGMGGNRHGFDFQNLHRNKRSMTLNLREPEGVAIFKQLARDADIVVENYRPDVKRRLGIDYESLRPINPRLIYGSISGFGQSGPYRDRPGRRPDRPGHGRPDVHHRHPGPGARCAWAFPSPTSARASSWPRASWWPSSSGSAPARASGCTPRSSRRCCPCSTSRPRAG